MTQGEAATLVGSLFEAWYGSLVRYVCRATQNLELAEDVVQESFLQLYRELRRGNEIRNPKAWTLCVARREITRRQRPHTYEGSKHEPLEVLETRSSGRVDWEEPHSEWDEVARLTSLLTKREEEVVLLRLEALKYREIAAQLGISPNSVGTLLARALRKMRKAAQSKSSEQGISIEEQDVENGDPKTLQ